MDATMENKMGLPPPYEPNMPAPAPPPSYFGNNPPPPPGFYAGNNPPNAPPTAPPRNARTQVITTRQPVATSASTKVGPGPTGATCQSCGKQIVTRVEYVPNNRTHIVSAALCILAGCCCGCLVPYCMRSCKTANHYCPSCKAFVGTHHPS